MPERLTTQNLGHRYPGGNADVLSGLNLSIQSGEMVVIRGASGSGKTTLLSILGGMLRPSTGKVLIDNVELSSMSSTARTRFRAEHVGFVFQSMHLLPFLNVMQNAMLAAASPRSAKQAPSPSTQPTATDVVTQTRNQLEHFGLGSRLNHLPAQLSVGERQRVALVRALMQQPKILLADEPTGNLDPDNSQLVVDGLKQFQQQGGTVILATHASNADLGDLQPSQQLSLPS
jgi:putative ABC transport system ATP-binding protein